MTTSLRTVSRHHPLHHQHNAVRLILNRYPLRSHATQQKPPKDSDSDSDLTRHEKAALFQLQGLLKPLLINPPRSTLPPPLKLPEQGNDNVALYYFRIGRAYGSFYWTGIKAVWFNHQAAKLLKERIKQDSKFQEGVRVEAQIHLMSRSEFQLLERNNYDIGKLPFFGLLVALFGEWLPLIVPWIPGAVPGTCRIPKQIEGMRRKSEERRGASFRAGIEEPQTEDTVHAQKMLGQLRSDQLLHLSSTLNLHNRMWDRLQIAPPASMLRKKIAKHMAYLADDDTLLLRQKSNAAKVLGPEEVQIACEERGLDVLGKREEVLRSTLHEWLERQKREQGGGKGMLTMLFRRPNGWNMEKGMVGGGGGGEDSEPTQRKKTQ